MIDFREVPRRKPDLTDRHKLQEVKTDEGSVPTTLQSEGGAGQAGTENNAPAVEEQQATVRTGPRPAR